MGRYRSIRGSTFLCIIYMLSTVVVYESKKRGVTAVFVFGDSLVDVGNNNYIPFSIAKANFPPNGIDFPGRVPTGRFSNGLNAADFLEKAGLPSSPPFLSPENQRNMSSFFAGVNFASGGAGIFNGTYHNDILGQSISLSRQVDYYVHHVRGDLIRLVQPYHDVRTYLSRSVFAVVIGSNDLLHYFRRSDLRRRTSIQRYASSMAAKLKEQLERLYDNGARKFLAVGTGEIGCIPARRLKFRGAKCDEEANHGSLAFNEALKTTMEELKAQLHGMNYSFFDSYKAMHDISNDPILYGFREIKAGCCGLGKLRAEIPCVPFATYCTDREHHLFWDMYHPTQQASRVFVDFIFDGSPDYVFPINLKQLVSAP
ncbi:PREDICTED: GDSL esterase/lipase At5g55050-like isoform X2 [Tarenaya hassleriana]|uniref:GDSL esterase/lipase At5g55050-like isoform X2 n=1 Tax=Tarenaya hassleriana TaxID=28532 RepID=UPI00053C4FCF|nr:PREDICTED: GDSL esterase/lipase At5g55050-like isoform X2 [Tarenaya hassleriana]